MLFLWLFMVSATIGVIVVDHRRRAAAARRSNQPLFEIGKPRAYLVLAFISAVLPLPVYFYATRKTKAGLVIGVAWVLAIVVMAASSYRFLDARMTVWLAVTNCERKHKTCDVPATMYRSGGPVYPKRDLARAIELYNLGCDSGDPAACAGLAEVYAREHDRNRELAYRNRTLDICRQGYNGLVRLRRLREGVRAPLTKTKTSRTGDLTPEMVAP